MRSAFAWISQNRLYELARRGRQLTPWLGVRKRVAVALRSS